MWVLKKGLSFENIETTIVLGTTRVRIFPLYSMRNIDPLLQRRGPKPVNFYKHLSWSFPDFGGGWEAKRRFPANGSEEPSPGVSKDAFDASSYVREKCLRANHFGPLPAQGGGLGPRLIPYYYSEQKSIRFEASTSYYAWFFILWMQWRHSILEFEPDFCAPPSIYFKLSITTVPTIHTTPK